MSSPCAITRPSRWTEVRVCYLGDGRNNTANSLLVTGALLGMDTRIVAPAQSCSPRLQVRDLAAELAARSGARTTVTDDLASGVAGADFLYTDVWVSMGEPPGDWDQRIDLLLPYQVNAAVLAPTGNPGVKFMHCLPALHNVETEIGQADLRQARPRGAGGDRRGLRITGLDRVRPGGEPAAHDQGPDGGDARADQHENRGARSAATPCWSGARRREPRSRKGTCPQAVTALAPLAREHELVITHGNGPQVGLLALESAGDPALAHPYPLDVLGAQTQGMIGYWLVQALQNELPRRRSPAWSAGPWSARPTRRSPARPNWSGPSTTEQQARQLRRAHGWDVGKDGAWPGAGSFRHLSPSRLLDLPLICTLEGTGVIVICAGGGGMPVVRTDGGQLRGVEAVVDKDLTAALLAEGLGADALLLLTDVAAVQDGYGTPQARPVRHVTPGELRARSFPAGSMGPKVEAACRFVELTGGLAAIGRLDDAAALLAGTAGTIVQDAWSGRW